MKPRKRLGVSSRDGQKTSCGTNGDTWLGGKFRFTQYCEELKLARPCLRLMSERTLGRTRPGGGAAVGGGTLEEHSYVQGAEGRGFSGGLLGW